MNEPARSQPSGASAWREPGRRVRAAREASGLSLREVAKRIGVSPATLSHIENDKVGLSVERLEAIAQALDMDASSILHTSDARRRRPKKPGAGRPKVEQSEPGSWRDYGPLVTSPTLDAALIEFLTVGYHGTSMRSIAARSGLPTSSIYRQFTGKQDILMQILDLTMTDLEWRTAAAESEGDTAVGRFCLVVENLALFHAHRRQLGFIGASEVRALEPRNQAAISSRRNRQQSLVDEHVYAAIRLGEFEVLHPDDASRAVVTMCTALPTWWQPEGRLSADAIAAEYVDYALDIMRYRGPRVH
jgi:AcrR family transcriptional regulator